MTNKKSTKRALLSSILAMVLCCSMLIGTTFAWFTDSVTSKGNIIKTGTLNVEMYWSEGSEAPADDTWKDASVGAIFNNTLWEPGYTEARHLKIANEGSLALKYQLAIIPNGDVSELADVIDVYYQSPAKQISADRQNLGTKVGTLADVIRTGIHDGALAAGTAYTATIVLKMQESAGNEYQDLSIGTSFSIQLIATQMASEEDSFGPDYDENAWADGMVVHTASDLKAALNKGGNIKVVGTLDFDEAENYDAWGAGNTYEVMLDAELVPNLTGGSYVMDEGAKYGLFAANSGQTLTLSDMDLTTNSQWSLYIANYNGGNTVLNNVNVTAEKGAGLYSYYDGTITLNNVNINHEALDDAYASTTPWAATAVATSNGQTMIINSGTYVGATYALYVYSSGANVTINGGTFKAPVVVAADAQNGANAYVTINGGNFDGKFESVNVWGGSEALITINGGTFTNFSTTANKRITIKGGTFDADPTQWLASGYTALQNADGTYTVLKGDVAVSNSDALVDAINAGKKNIVLASGDYALRFTNNTAFNLDGRTLVGLDGVKLSISSSEVSYGRIQGDDVTFENITFTNGTVGATGKATYNNCTFEGVLECASSNAAETYVNDCEIKGYIHTSTDMNAGAAFVTDSKLGGAAYNARNTMTFTDCEIGEINIWGGNTVLNGCTYASINNMGSGTVTVDGAVLATTATELKNAITNANGGKIQLNGEVAVEDLMSPETGGGIQAETTIVGGTLSRDTASGNPLTVWTTEKVTFEDVTFETEKGSAVLALRKAGSNVEINDCTFTNFGAPSTGNTGIQVYAADVTIVFNGCTFNNMPIVTSSSYAGAVKMVFNDCTFTWTGANCPGMVQLANNVVADVAFNDCSFTYDMQTSTRAKCFVSTSTSCPAGTKVTFNNFTVTGISEAGYAWTIVSKGGVTTGNNLVVTATGTNAYTVNGETVDFDTYLYR